MRTWRILARNAGTSLIATMVGFAAGFLVMPFIISRLGPTQFGIWVLVTGLVGYAGLLDVGLGPALVKHAAALLSTPDSDAELNRIVNGVFGLYLLLGVVAVAGLFAAALGFAGHFKIPAGQMHIFRVVLLIVGVQTALGFPMSVWHGLTASLQDYHVINTLGLITNTARSLLSVVVLALGYGLIGLVVMGAAMSAVVWIYLWIRVRRRIPGLRIHPSLFRLETVRSLVSFTGSMLAWSGAGYSLHQLDRVLIGALLPVASLTTYEVGNKLSESSRSVLHSWLNTVLPSASALRAEARTDELRALYLRATKYLMASYLPIAISLIAFGSRFIELWVGPAYARSAIILALLVIGNLWQSQNVIGHVMLVGIGEVKVFTRVMMAYPILVVGSAVILVPKLGIVGMAVALLTAIVIAESSFMPFILRAFNARGTDFLSSVLGPLCIPAIVTSGIAWAIGTSFARPGWLGLACEVAVTVAVFVILFLRTGLDTTESRRLREVFKGRWSFVSPAMRVLLPSADQQ